MITVFYDGKCGLCRREIDHYKRIAPNNIFVWQDITTNISAIEAIGVQYTEGLKLLHAQDTQGKLHVGVDAFLLIWQHIPRWKILGMFVQLPFVRPVASMTYRAFAAWRFKKLGYDCCGFNNA
jgi:predicted DCC family thiol-disulfide oxidoreductase YuxK